MGSFAFFIGLALILTHEMDAIKCHEWRIFPFTSRLNDKTGYLTFTAAHVPLYLLLLWGLYRPSGFNTPFLITGLNLFFIIHLALHIAYLKHPKNEFKSPFSWVLIAGAAIAGAVSLMTS
jgi:hypothetical protein